MNTLITISREFGSGGRELGRRLSELLNIAYYDQEIITEISRRTDLAERYRAGHRAKAHSRLPPPYWPQSLSIVESDL